MGPSNSSHPRSRRGVAICLPDPETTTIAAGAAAGIGREVVATGATPGELLSGGRAGGIACVILGAHRPDEELGRAVAVIRGELGPVPVVAICDRAGGADVRRALRSGIDGVVLKRQADEALMPVLAAVCAGQASVPGVHRSELETDPLSAREKQVLVLVARGLTNAQIANRLYLAESTVKSHLSAAFGKLNVSSRHEAADIVLDPERGSRLGIFPGLVPRAPTSA